MTFSKLTNVHHSLLLTITLFVPLLVSTLTPTAVDLFGPHCVPSINSGVAYTHICKGLISRHYNSCTRLSTSIINDPLPPLHPCLAIALPTSSFKHLRCRTSLYKNSLIPSLARHLVNPIFPKERSLYLFICWKFMISLSWIEDNFLSYLSYHGTILVATVLGT